MYMSKCHNVSNDANVIIVIPTRSLELDWTVNRNRGFIFYVFYTSPAVQHSVLYFHPVSSMVVCGVSYHSSCFNVISVDLFMSGHGKQPIMVDHSAPIPGDVLDGNALSNIDYQPYSDRMCAQWPRWTDPESGISR